jgi:hypothetical protein
MNKLEKEIAQQLKNTLKVNANEGDGEWLVFDKATRMDENGIIECDWETDEDGEVTDKRHFEFEVKVWEVTID